MIFNTAKKSNVQFVTKIATFFTSFLGKVVQSRENKKYDNEKFPFSRSKILLKKEFRNIVLLVHYNVYRKLQIFGKVNDKRTF